MYITSTLLCLLSASGSIVGEYFIRRDVNYDSAQPLFPIQTFLCCFSFCCLFCGRKKHSKSNGREERNEDKVVAHTSPKQCLFFDPLSKHQIEVENKCNGSGFPAFRSFH